MRRFASRSRRSIFPIIPFSCFFFFVCVVLVVACYWLRPFRFDLIDSRYRQMTRYFVHELSDPLDVKRTGRKERERHRHSFHSREEIASRFFVRVRQGGVCQSWLDEWYCLLVEIRMNYGWLHRLNREMLIIRRVSAKDCSIQRGPTMRNYIHYCWGTLKEHAFNSTASHHYCYCITLAK